MIIMTEHQIAILDFGKSNSELVTCWNSAFSTTGFALLTNCGIDTSQLYSLAKGFFKEDASSKESVAHRNLYGAPGYTPQGIEHVHKSINPSRPDEVESLVFKHKGHKPDLVPNEIMRSEIIKYWEAMEKLLNRIMKISALALNIPEDYFDDAYSPGDHSLRLAYYPPLIEQDTLLSYRYGFPATKLRTPY